MPVSKTIPLHLIDDPEIAMRSDIDDAYLDSLAQDIGKNGLINPIAVRKVSDRYVVIAGHFRTLALRKLGREMAEVRDYTGDAVDPETIKCRENLGRRDVNDADVAVYLAQIQEKHHHTLERLQEMTGESEHWISTRLALFNGDQAVFEALRTGKINLTQAGLLNRFPEQYRANYLDVVINSTPPARVIEQWLRDAKAQVAGMGNGQPQQQAPAADAPPPGVVVDCCELCGGDKLVWTLAFHRIHQHCWDDLVKAIAKAQPGGE